MGCILRVILCSVLVLVAQNIRAQDNIWIPIFNQKDRDNLAVEFRLHDSRINTTCSVVAIPKSYFSNDYRLFVSVVLIENNQLIYYLAEIKEKRRDNKSDPTSNEEMEMTNQTFTRFIRGKRTPAVQKESKNFEKYCGPAVASLPNWIKKLFRGLFETNSQESGNTSVPEKDYIWNLIG